MTTKPKIQTYRSPAGGWGAIAAKMRVLSDQRTIVKGTRSLFRMNQPKGFKCPGCAWPDPADRAPLIFCENGAKALAWETTAKRVTPDFFAAHTVSWLEQQSDYWLEEQGRPTDPMVYVEGSAKYIPTACDAAFALIGRCLTTLPSPHHARC